MKKKVQKALQQPIVISLLVVVMIVSFGFALYFSQPPVVEETETPVYGLVGVDDVRSGQQELGISILPADGEVDATVEEEVQDIEYLSPEELDVPTTIDPKIEVPGDSSQSTIESALHAGDNVRFKIDRFQKLATQPLKFNVYDDDMELKPEYLKSIHGEKVHLYIVHANLREFMHITPEYKNNVWNASANLPTKGTYYAYVIFHPLKKSPIAFKTDLIVRSESDDDIKMPDPTAGLEFDDGNLKAKMTMQRLNGNRLFTFHIMNGAKAAALQPYLETLGQVTFFKHDDSSLFINAPSNLSSVDGEGNAYFTTESLSPGRYTVFSEFKVDGKVYIFPFTFDIGTL